MGIFSKTRHQTTPVSKRKPQPVRSTLQRAADNSPQTLSLKALQRMADESSQVSQLQEMALVQRSADYEIDKRDTPQLGRANLPDSPNATTDSLKGQFLGTRMSQKSNSDYLPNETRTEAPHTGSKPLLQRQLANGDYQTNQAANLRSNDFLHTSLVEIAQGVVVNVTTRNDGSNSQFAPLFGSTQEHSWSTWADNNHGWIDDRKLTKVPEADLEPTSKADTSSSGAAEIYEVALGVNPVEIPLLCEKMKLKKKTTSFSTWAQDHDTTESDNNNIRNFNDALDQLQAAAQQDNTDSDDLQTTGGKTKSEYQRAAEKTEEELRRQAERLGYNLRNNDVLKAFNLVVGLKASLDYDSINSINNVMLP